MNEGWWPTEKQWKNQISKGDWKKLLADDKIFTDKSKIFLKRLLHNGGEATCADLAKKYGRTASFYIGVEKGLANRILKEKKLLPIMDGNREWLFPILFLGRHVDKLKDGNAGDYIWKLRPELKAALEEINLLNDERYPLYERTHDWKTLLIEYRKLLQNDDTRKVAFDDEEYKWKTITDCKNLKGKQTLSYLTDSKSNLFDHFALGEAKYLLARSDFDSIYEKLIDDDKKLNGRLEEFKNSILEAYSESDKNRLIKDERSASVFLTCHNPQKYTFYKDSYYSSLCKYLEILSETAGNKYVHYLSLIEDFEKAVVADSTIIDFYRAHTEKYEQSTKLITQNIIYVLFESGRNLIKLANGESEMTDKITEYKNLLLNTHNLILHGAPGTGKTYLAKEIAESMGAEVGFVQFHPSYDYTDFVEGLRPLNSHNGQIGFERKDGVFKKFCEKALKNLIGSKKSVVEIEKEQSVDEKINVFISDAIESNTEFEIATGNKFFITDMTDKSIVVSIPANEKTNELSLSRAELQALLSSDTKIENGNDIREFFSRKWRTQQDSYTIALYKKIKNMKSVESSNSISKIEKKDFIFIIDEINRGEMSKIFGELFFSIDPGYRGIKGKIKTQYQNLIEDGETFVDGFYVPENVYIIGTMNDIDRSVESMDFAFRRRFTFKEITAKETREGILNAANISDEDRNEAIKRMDALNNAISKIDGLSSAYHIGGAYFKKLEELSSENNKFDALWNHHLEGLLREYLRGMEDESGLLESLKNAYLGNFQVSNVDTAENKGDEK